ncbi:hypothetical protein CPB85DRAFT_1443515 [Mucidula mucida]|nr:hypothetical protein CPB85DRAFT_1443515 [Mucidula mucida]
MDAESRALVQVLQHTQIINYFNMSAIVLYVFDYLSSLDQEVGLIWGSDWTVTKFLYLVTRYLPFIDMGLVLYDNRPNMTPETCVFVSRLNGWMFTAGIVLAEVIFSLRTWAVWNRPRFLTVGMPVLFLASLIPAFVIMSMFLRSLQSQVLPLPNFKSCFISAANPIYRWEFVILMIYEAGEYHYSMLLLMVVKSYQQFREAREIGSSQLLHVVLKDGIIYYLYLSVLNITNVIVVSRLEPDLVGLFAVLERVIHAMLACRVVTNIRAQMKKQVIHGSKGPIGDLGSSVGELTFDGMHTSQHQ